MKTYDPIFDDSERDDVDPGQAFREENEWADAGRAFLREASEYQVDPMDDEALNPYEKFAKENEYDDILAYAPSEYLSNQELADKVDPHLSPDPFDDTPQMPPPPLPSDRGGEALEEWTDIWAEGENLAPAPPDPYELEKGPMGPLREPLTDFGAIAGELAKAYEAGEAGAPAPTDRDDRPNAVFDDFHGNITERWGDGREIKTPYAEWFKKNPDSKGAERWRQRQQKPGTGVNPAASMKAGSN